MQTVVVLWLACWIGVWVFIGFRHYSVWKNWLPAKGVIEEHQGSATGDSMIKVRILDGPYINKTSVMYIEDYGLLSALRVAQTIDVKLNPENAVTCVLPSTGNDVLAAGVAFLVTCVLPVTVTAWLYLSAR